MKQKQNSSNQEKTKISSNIVSFKQTIKTIEFNTFKQEFQRKKQISIKNKLKQSWLERIKIIPPYLNAAQREKFFRATDSFTEKESDCFKMFRHNYYKKDLFDDDIELLFQKRLFQLSSPTNEVSRSSKLQRRSYNPILQSPNNKVQNLKGRKLRQNWKLAYRRDQMNILRFSTASPKEGRILKTSDISQLVCGVEQLKEREERSSKLMYKKMAESEEEYNKQNIEEKIQQKKEERKFRLNVKKGKTSLIIKKPAIL